MSRKTVRDYSYKLIQDGLEVARVFAPTDKEAKKEIEHYRFMYSQDGLCQIVKITRQRKRKKK